MVNEIAIKTIPELDLGCNVGEVLIGWWLKLHERGYTYLGGGCCCCCCCCCCSCINTQGGHPCSR